MEPKLVSGQPAQILIDPALLQQIQNAMGDTIDTVGPIAGAVLKQGSNLAIDASAVSVKARVGIPSVNPIIDVSAASAKKSIEPRIQASVERSIPEVKDVANRSVESSVKEINSSYRSVESSVKKINSSLG
jgi:hypothetical protein